MLHLLGDCQVQFIIDVILDSKFLFSKLLFSHLVNELLQSD